STAHLTDDPPRKSSVKQEHGLERVLDNRLIDAAWNALANGGRVRGEFEIRNLNRSVGTMLGYELTKRWGGAGLPEASIDFTFTGSAGQSFGAFVPKGIKLTLVGDANDYVGKGLSGGTLVLRPDSRSTLVAEENIIAGNVILYGATAGKAFIRGVVGERFCVRNSGATAVVEGVGDHGCEYMTGGRVVVLGATGRNFGAGMSGGEAFVWDPQRRFAELANPEMIDLDPLEEEDRSWLFQIISEHLRETGSARAEAILAKFDFEVDRFVKAFPRDYKRVLMASRRASAQGA
ncbi:MAG: glutamate synthase subunit alpha, partial [Actinomycetota bacterium]|nr:glutamate synthase subunit alpha [Actinomycetota bacterium]